jgi:hypothetical protein
MNFDFRFIQATKKLYHYYLILYLIEYNLTTESNLQTETINLNSNSLDFLIL